MQAEAASDLPWPRLTAFIAEKTGLHFPPERRKDLQRSLAVAAAEAGFPDLTAYVDWLMSAPLTRSQLHGLASHLTIGETYFFRERKTFDAVAQRVLPELLERRGTERHLRLWSAACCTGEEAYSLAILLRQCIPDIARWRITLLATDINERFLQKAVAGVYGEWSFRESPPELKERYFKRTPEGRYALIPEIKQMVTFAPLNLAADGFPSVATNTHAMDLIFCRNLLMYFTPPQARKAIDQLRQALRDECWLAVSPTEGSHTLFADFEQSDFPGATLYRKKSATPRAIQRPRLPESAHAAESFELPAPPPATTAPAAPPPQTQREAPGPVARALANEGRSAEALSWCNRWITEEPLDAAARYLHAVIHQELGNGDEARRSLQRALYLQPDFVLAHIGMGNLARSSGAHREAHKHFTNALALLRNCAPEDSLPESDGLTAARLTEMLHSLLALETAA